MTLLPAYVNEFSEETREASPSNILIKIESFSLLTKCGIKKHESRVFEAGSYKWKLIISFEGNESENEEDCHVSVYLSMAETDSLPLGWEVNAIFTFFLHNHVMGYYHCFRGMTRRFNAVNRKWGFPKLISKQHLIDPSNGYVVEDSCVFGAEVFVVENRRINECLCLMDGASSTCKRELKLSNLLKMKGVWVSKEFVVGNHKWNVLLYPKGCKGAKGDYVSIFLECVDSKNSAPHHKVKAEVCMCIKSKNFHCSRKFDHWFASSSDIWGFIKFMPIAEVRRRETLVKNCCFLEIEISVQALVLDACA